VSVKLQAILPLFLLSIRHLCGLGKRLLIFYQAVYGQIAIAVIDHVVAPIMLSLPSS